MNVARAFGVRGSYPQILRIKPQNHTPVLYEEWLPDQNEDSRSYQGWSKCDLGKHLMIQRNIGTDDAYEAPKRSASLSQHRKKDSKVKLNLQEEHSKTSLGDDWFKYLASESRTRDYPAQLQTVDARGDLEVGGRGWLPGICVSKIPCDQQVDQIASASDPEAVGPTTGSSGGFVSRHGKTTSGSRGVFGVGVEQEQPTQSTQLGWSLWRTSLGVVLLPASRRHELTEGRLVQGPGEQNFRLQFRQPQIERLAGNPADSHILKTLNYLLKQVMEKKLWQWVPCIRQEVDNYSTYFTSFESWRRSFIGNSSKDQLFCR